MDVINNGFSNPAKPLPLGVSFSDRVSIKQIDKRTAHLVYKHHHSYMDGGNPSSSAVHGVYLDDRLVGAISYGYMLASEDIHGIPSDKYMSVSRVCIAIDMPNLASCAMAKSKDLFAKQTAQNEDIELLVTYVREDYDGTMFDALDDWEYNGHIAKGHQAGNRSESGIRDYDKRRYVCFLSD